MITEAAMVSSIADDLLLYCISIVLHKHECLQMMVLLQQLAHAANDAITTAKALDAVQAMIASRDAAVFHGFIRLNGQLSLLLLTSMHVK